MSAERYSLDTNVFFYAIDPSDSDRHHRAVEIIELAATKLDCVITLQAFCEFFAVVRRKGKMTVDEASAQVDDWRVLFATAYPSPGSLKRAIEAVRLHNLSFWDAFLWSVAREAGVTVLLTEDLQHGRELGGVRFWNPFGSEGPFPTA